MSAPRRVHAARSAAYAALGASRPLAARADDLQDAADLVAAVPADGDNGVTASAWRAYSAGLLALAQIGRWDSATVAAETDADRHLRAARRGAEIALELTDSQHPACEPIAVALQQLTVATSLADADATAAQLLAAPLATPLIGAADRLPTRSQPKTPELTPEPRAVCVVSVDDSPLMAPVIVRAGMVHSFTLMARVLDWPEDMPELVLRPVSVWPSSAVEATEVRLSRPAETEHGIREAEGVSRVVLHAADSAGEPLSFTITGELIGDEHREIPVLGYESFAVRAYDPALDVVTGVDVLDGRLREIFAKVREKVTNDELSAFARLMSATCRAAVRIQADNIFRKGTKVPEDDFQEEIQARLGMAPELAGRLDRRQQAGGITDLVHDGIVLELKVETDRSVTVEIAARYVGQPVQYASGGGRQLSLLCILDMSTKSTPVGVLANSVYLLEPAIHEGEDAPHPSWVGVIVIGGDLPVPSAWSGTAISARLI